MEYEILKLFENKDVVVRLKNRYKAIGKVVDVARHTLILNTNGVMSAYDHLEIATITEVKGKKK